MKLKKMVSSLSLMLMLFGATIVPASAHNVYDYRDNNRYYGNSRIGSYMDRHPYVKKAAIGGGAGAAIGALISRDGSRINGAVKGALIGAGAGLGYEYLRRRW